MRVFAGASEGARRNLDLGGKSLKGGGSQDLAEGWNACWIEKKAGNWLRFLALSKMKEGTRLTVG